MRRQANTTQHLRVTPCRTMGPAIKANAEPVQRSTNSVAPPLDEPTHSAAQSVRLWSGTAPMAGSTPNLDGAGLRRRVLPHTRVADTGLRHGQWDFGEARRLHARGPTRRQDRSGRGDRERLPELRGREARGDGVGSSARARPDGGGCRSRRASGSGTARHGTRAPTECLDSMKRSYWLAHRERRNRVWPTTRRDDLPESLGRTRWHRRTAGPSALTHPPVDVRLPTMPSLT